MKASNNNSRLRPRSSTSYKSLIHFRLTNLMAAPLYFTPRLILAGAALFGMLLALGVHILGQRFGLNLGDLWNVTNGSFIPARTAIAWWLISAVAFVSGYVTAILLHSAVSGQLPRRMQQALIGGG